jgi:hypothetical protein
MNDTEWLPFLLKPENLACALEVGAHYIHLKQAALNNVYGQIEAELQAHLESKSANKIWSANRDTASEPWPAVYTWPEHHPDKCPGVYVRLERSLYQGQSRFALGVATTTGVTLLDSKQTKPLIDALEGRDFAGTNKWWVRRRWLDYYPDDHGFCVDAMSSKDIQNDLIAAVRDVFDEFREGMELLNEHERSRFQNLVK